MNHCPPPFDLLIGLDRSDSKADWHLIDTHSGQTRSLTLGTSPEALHDWLADLRQQFPNARVALCLEQPAASLILFLETYAWITLYAIKSGHSAKVPRSLRHQPGQGRRQRRPLPGRVAPESSR